MKLKTDIHTILRLLNQHMLDFPDHKDSCVYLKNKFESFEKALNEKKDLSEYVEWCKWFAPRIIYDGIGDKKILDVLEKLNNCASQMP